MFEGSYISPVDLPPYADWTYGRWGAAKVAHAQKRAELAVEQNATWSRVKDWPGRPGKILKLSELTDHHKAMIKIHRDERDSLVRSDPEMIVANQMVKRVRKLLDCNMVAPNAAGWRSLATAISGSIGVPLSLIVLDSRALVAATGRPHVETKKGAVDPVAWGAVKWMRLAMYLAIHHTKSLKLRTIGVHVENNDLVREKWGAGDLERYSRDIAVEDAMHSAEQSGTPISEGAAHRIACAEINQINGPAHAILKPATLKKSRENSKRIRSAVMPQVPGVSAGFLTHALIFAPGSADVRTLPIELLETIHAVKVHSYLSRIIEQISTDD